MNVPGYALILDQMYETHGMARAAFYINENVKYTRHKELGKKTSQ